MTHINLNVVVNHMNIKQNNKGFMLVESIIVVSIISIFIRQREIILPWENIISVGSEFIIVNMPYDTEIVTLM